MLAAIVALDTLKESCRVALYSDSKYVVDSMEQGWATRWRANGWRRSKKERAKNPDLWDRLLNLYEAHDVQFRWVRGHAGVPENERCDQLATEAANQPNLPVDDGYESGSALL